MSWANCGQDSQGRDIGYAIKATCDDPDCETKIDRGLAYACGGIHGHGDSNGTSHGCEGYFCYEHLFVACPDGESGPTGSYCRVCRDEIEQSSL